MGAAISNNVANQIIQNSNAIANKYIQSCSSQANSSFNLDILRGCKSNIGTVDISTSQVIDVTCAQNTTTRDSMRSDIKAQIIQQATAAVQSLGGPALAVASNLTDVATTAASTITDSYTQSCLGTATASNNILCSDPDSGLNIGLLKVEDTQTARNTCVATNITTNGLVASLSTVISTTTNASEADTLIIFVIIGLVVLAFVGIFFLYTLNGPIGWVIVGIFVLIVIGIVIYATLAFTDKLYPFNTKTAV